MLFFDGGSNGGGIAYETAGDFLGDGFLSGIPKAPIPSITGGPAVSSAGADAYSQTDVVFANSFNFGGSGSGGVNSSTNFTNLAIVAVLGGLAWLMIRK